MVSGENPAGRGVNALEITGTIVKSEDLRWTPAGLPVWEGVIRHEAEVEEAGAMRRLEFDLPAVAFTETAQRLTRLSPGARLRIRGFLAPRSARSSRLVAHVTAFEN